MRTVFIVRPSASESVKRPTFARSVWSAHGAAHVPTPSAPHEAGHSAGDGAGGQGVLHGDLKGGDPRDAGLDDCQRADRSARRAAERRCHAGLTPLEVALTRDELLEVGDPDLATAVEWILDAEPTRP